MIETDLSPHESRGHYPPRRGVQARARAWRRGKVGVLGQELPTPLRAERAGYPDEDDDANAPTPPKPVEAAPPGADPKPAV